MKKLTLTLLTLSLIHIAFAQPGDEWKQKVAPALIQETANGSTAPFLILLTKQADVTGAKHLKGKVAKATYVFEALQAMSASSQENIISFLKNRNVTYQSLFIVNAIRCEGDLQLIHTLALRPDVGSIIDDPLIYFPEPVEWNAPHPSRTVIEWGIDMINADEVWAMGYRGQGVTVGGGDTGYDWDHPALKKQYRGFMEGADTVDHNYHWHDAIHMISPLNSDSLNPCGLDSPVPCDDRGHGTHTMGTMVGLDSLNEIGVAPEAKWCACRNMERGWGSPNTYLECFQWFLAPTDLNNENPDPSLAPHVINNSWGCPKIEGCDSSNWQIMELAVENLRSAGIVVVVSAGNNGSSCSSVAVAPGFFEGSFSVGATAINDTIAGFSSRGPVAVDSSFRIKPNVSAPGVNVRSASPGGGYTSSSGTSMAAPHVSGLVALIISAAPELAGEVEIIETIIEETSIPKTTDQNCGDVPGTEVPNNTYGYGRVDAKAAVEHALALIEVSTDDPGISTVVKVYPNPFRDQLTIMLDGLMDKGSIEFFDIHGKVLFRKEWNADHHSLIRVQMNDHPAGIYFYRIMSNGIVVQGKAVKG